MVSLKDLRVRIRGIKSTQKITSAMKMVAAAKLRRAQERVEAIRPYEQSMRGMVNQLLLRNRVDITAPPLLLTGHANFNVHLLIVVTSDRGLCGGFNSAIVREAKTLIQNLQEQGKNVKIFCVGRRGQLLLKRDYADLIIESISHGHKTEGQQTIENFLDALTFTKHLEEMLKNHQFAQASILFSTFKSVLRQTLTHQLLIPFSSSLKEESESHAFSEDIYEYEPDLHTLLEQLLPRYLAVSIYRIFLENNASEQGARMTAMDNATQNARDILKRLELVYNQTRQAYITNELIEIIAGAKAI